MLEEVLKSELGHKLINTLNRFYVDIYMNKSLSNHERKAWLKPIHDDLNLYGYFKDLYQKYKDKDKTESFSMFAMRLIEIKNK